MQRMIKYWNDPLSAKPKTFMDFVRKGDIASVLKALEGGDAKAKANGEKQGEEKQAMTPLTLACQLGDPKMVGLLLDRNASVDKPNNGPYGCQPIFWALRHPGNSDHLQCLGYLLDHKAEINSRDPIGYTPLM